MLVPDGNGEFTEGMGMLVDKSDLGFGKRSWRYSMLVKDGVVQKMFVEPQKPGDPFEVSDADTMLAHINAGAKAPDQVAIFTRDGCQFCAKAKSAADRARVRLRRGAAAAHDAQPRRRRRRRREDGAAGLRERPAHRQPRGARSLGAQGGLSAHAPAAAAPRGGRSRQSPNESPTNPTCRIMDQLNVDVAVIGAGTAGLAAYRAAVAAGKRAVIIEGGPHGTTCARVGCMPSKLLIAAAEAAHAPARWPEFGLRLEGEVRVDGRAVMARDQARARPLRRVRAGGRGRDSRRRPAPRPRTVRRRPHARHRRPHARRVRARRDRDGLGAERPAVPARARRPPDRQRRRLRLGRPAPVGGDLRAGRDRPGARAGAAPARRARAALRPRRARRPVHGSRSPRVRVPHVPAGAGARSRCGHPRGRTRRRRGAAPLSRPRWNRAKRPPSTS